MHTKDRLAAELARIGAFDMAALAATGRYDDYLSPLDMPIAALVDELHALKTPAATLLAARVMDGEFDATKEESDAWARSPEGKAAFDELTGGWGKEARARRAKKSGNFEPIPDAQVQEMNVLAETLDQLFNDGAKGADRRVGFTLFTFPMGQPGRTNFISNANRKDMIESVESWLRRARAV